MALRYNDRSRRLSDDAEVFSFALRHSPVLTAAAGTAVIAGGCTTAANAIVLSVMMLVMLPVMGLISAFEMERIRYEVRLAAYCGISAMLIFVLSLIIDSVVLGSVEALGIYAPLTAFSSLVLARTADDAPILTKREAMFEGLAGAAVFALIAIPTGVIREIVGKGELFGGWLGFSGTKAFSEPWMGFILCGLAAAIIRRAADRPERNLRTLPDEEVSR